MMDLKQDTPRPWQSDVKLPTLPKAVEDFADTVLRYRPKPKSAPAKNRKRRASKIAKERA